MHHSTVTSRLTVSEVLARQGLWITAGFLASAVLAVAGTWAEAPSLALVLAMAAGVVVVNPRMWWSLPVAMLSIVLGGLGAELARVPAVLGAGAAAGLCIAAVSTVRVDWLDVLNSVLASCAGAGAGLWSATVLHPDPTGSVVGVLLIGSLSCLGASMGLWPLALGPSDGLPTAREVRRILQDQYRPPVLRALELYAGAARHAPDPDARQGLVEVVRWVFHLQQSLQEQDSELAQIDPQQVQQRIEQAQRTISSDAFTRERVAATARHLSRLLSHRAALETERGRHAALSEYALAFLEEARAGAALGRVLPGEAAPDRLGDVLSRLREHAAEGEARRQTVRELQTA